MVTFVCPRRYLTGTIAILACLTSGSSSLGAQDTRPAFRASVALVPITAVVRDGKNRVVPTLQKDDFEVLEDSQPRRVVDFSATDRGPVSLAVLFDTSGSMRGPNLRNAKAVVHELLDRLNHTSDEAALFTFDNVLSQETPFTNDRHRIRTALNNTEGWGLTSLYDAIAQTAKQLAERQAQRRVVIVVSDGVDTSSTLTPPDVSGLASAIDVPVYIIAVGPARPSPDDTGGHSSDGGLANLAYWTGGDLRRVGAPDQAEEAVGALMTELRQQYFLAIESAATSGWYRLDVRTRRKGLTVRARSGYFATALAEPGSGG
jgi:Ca-activated chloride channel homolog